MKSNKKLRVVTVLVTVEERTEQTYSPEDVVNCLKIKSAIPEIKVLAAIASDNQ